MRLSTLVFFCCALLAAPRLSAATDDEAAEPEEVLVRQTAYCPPDHRALLATVQPAASLTHSRIA